MKNKNDITTAIGFYNTYFELLPLFKTKIEAFKYLNKKVLHITSIKPYNSFKQFQNN